MLKTKSIIIILITLFLVIIMSSSIYAATLNEVKYSNSKITISGTCTTSNQVQVIVFDLNKQPMYFATASVTNNKFNKTLDATFNLEEEKNYTVKISDYDGKNVSEGNFTVAKVDNKVGNNEKDDTPKTGTIEYIAIASIVIVISALGISIFKRKEA